LDGVNAHNLNKWVNGDHSLSHASLVQILRGLCHGFIPGNRNDVTMIIVRRAVLQEMNLTTDPRPDIKTFADLVHAIKEAKRGKTDADFAKISGIERHHMNRLSAGVGPAELRPTPETIQLFLEYLYSPKSPRRPVLPKISTPVPAIPVSIPATLLASNGVAAPVSGEPEGVEEVSLSVKTLAAPSPGQWMLSMADHLEQAVVLLRANVPQTPSPAPAEQDFSAVVRGDIPVGEDLEGIRFCFTEASFREFSGRQFSAAEVEDTRKLLTELRRRFTIIAGLDKPFKSICYKQLAREIDELHIVVSNASGLGAGMFQVLDAQRKTFDQIRDGKKG